MRAEEAAAASHAAGCTPQTAGRCAGERPRGDRTAGRPAGTACTRADCRHFYPGRLWRSLPAGPRVARTRGGAAVQSGWPCLRGALCGGVVVVCSGGGPSPPPSLPPV
eukprot:scaffold246_cov414-Prasinococcus_capsulatus_cf.AAC.1